MCVPFFGFLLLQLCCIYSLAQFVSLMAQAGLVDRRSRTRIFAKQSLGEGGPVKQVSSAEGDRSVSVPEEENEA